MTTDYLSSLRVLDLEKYCIQIFILLRHNSLKALNLLKIYEFKINIQPQFLASFKSQLFIVQENGRKWKMNFLRFFHIFLKNELF